MDARWHAIDVGTCPTGMWSPTSLGGIKAYHVKTRRGPAKEGLILDLNIFAPGASVRSNHQTQPVVSCH
jgi:hypothetical protein